MFELDAQKSISTYIAGILRSLHIAYENDTYDESRVNLIATLEIDALSIIMRLDKDIIENTLGEASIDSIRALISDSGEVERKLEWVHFYILEKNKGIKKE
jgi:hypothetical protein